jgi:hypothetical protein
VSRSAAKVSKIRRRRWIYTVVLPLLVWAGVSCGDRDPILFPSTTEVQAPGPIPLEGMAGLAVEPLPVIRAVDSRGNPTPGVAVRFSVQEGKGAVWPDITITDKDGFARPDSWILAETVGTNVLAVDVDGVDPTTFTVEGVAGPAARLERLAGDRQQAERGTTLPESIVLSVTDQFGNRVPGKVVTFESAPGHGSASPGEVTTGEDGFATTTWTLGTVDGTQRLRAIAPTGASSTFTANSAFVIELVFLEEPRPDHRLAFENAAARWESVMADGLVPVQMDLEPGRGSPGAPALHQVVEDVLIFVALWPQNSPFLGMAGPTWIRGDGWLPIVGFVLLNTNHLPRMERDGTLETVILHEMGHVLGIGALWRAFDLLRDPSLPDNRDADPHFNGPLAIAAFDAAGGVSYPGAKVPVENDFDSFPSPQGSLDGHWRTSVFGGELMVGRLDTSQPGHPLSAVTIAALADLGYEVHLSAADPYSLFDPEPMPATGALIGFHDDVYRGPIGVVDREGRPVREIRSGTLR